MSNSKTPWTDELSVNILPQGFLDALAAALPAPGPVGPVLSGTIFTVGDAPLVDAGASVGDVVTLINPATGEVGFAPPTGGVEFTQVFPLALATPGSNTPQVFTVTHNLGMYPKDIQVFATKISGEVKRLEDFYSNGVDNVGMGIAGTFTGIENTINTFNVAIFQTGNETLLPNPATVTVRLLF